MTAGTILGCGCSESETTQVTLLGTKLRALGVRSQRSTTTSKSPAGLLPFLPRVLLLICVTLSKPLNFVQWRGFTQQCQTPRYA